LYPTKDHDRDVLIHIRGKSMSTFHGVATAVISAVKDPLNQGRVQVHLPAQAGGVQEWARVATQAPGTYRPEVNDEVLVAFESGDLRRPIVIGNLWSGEQPPASGSQQAVHLPTGATLHPTIEASHALDDCAATADLQRQVAPWLSLAECLLKILALMKPLIDVVKGLPTPSVSALAQFERAAVNLAPCLLASSPAAAIPLIRDILCLTLRSLKCLVAQNATSAEITRAAVGIQGVLDLAAPFFSLSGIPAIQLGVAKDPSALKADIDSLQLAVDPLGGCDT
jgi:hypothetical protein